MKPRQAAGDKIPMEDYMPDFGNIVRGQMENAAEDPLNYAANAILTFYGGPALIRGGATVLGPIIKKFGTKQGPALFQKAKDLALRATTKPNPKAVYPKGVKAGDLTKAGKPYKPLPVKGPSGQTAVPRTVVDPVKVGVGTGLAIKAGDALFNGDDEATEPTNAVEYLQDIGRKQEEAGTIEAFRAKRRAEEERRRNQPKTGIAGALDKAKPLGGLALRLAEVLGRGAGASEGFEGAKILEESSRLRSEEAAIQLRRDQIAATTGQTEIRANATIDAMIGKAVADYTQGLTGGYLAAITAKAAEKGLEEGDPKVSAAVIKDYVTMLRSTMGSSMQGLGGSGGLSEDQRAELKAFVDS